MTTRVLSIASECAPFVKTGGLADVVGALAKALARQDVECRVLMPLYRAVAHLRDGAKPVLGVGRHHGGDVRVLAREEAGVDLLLIDAPHLFDRAGQIYLDEAGADWADNHLRFGLLSEVGAAIGRGAIPSWRPDVLHAHDWQAGLAPVYSAQNGPGAAPTILTIHNVAFQGVFGVEAILALGLDPAGFSADGYEYFGGVSFLKGGLMTADRITTVSPFYARELLTPEFGMGLEGVLDARRGALEGILNGIDIEVWNPADDAALAAPFTSRSLTKKAANRAALLDRFGLTDNPDAPVFAVISRLSEQKGLDLALLALPGVLDRGARLVLLGAGDAALEAGFADLVARYPHSAGAVFGFDEGLAHLIQAGSDAMLVPSRFEPCGLTQLCAMRYGTVPVVARTGGLADTVIDASAAALAAGCATGVQFAPTTADRLYDALDRTMTLFADKPVWRRIVRNGMKQPVGWDSSAARYAAIYRAVSEGSHDA